jgi:hypothetical protein
MQPPQIDVTQYSLEDKVCFEYAVLTPFCASFSNVGAMRLVPFAASA